MSEPFLGQINMFAGNYAPRNWAKCDGSLLPIAQYTALFSILGTTYGGDGRTTFGLPDLRGRAPVHAGQGPGIPAVVLGQKSGVAQTTLSVGNLPPHAHTVAPPCNTNGGTANDPEGKNPNASGANLIYGMPGANEFMAPTDTSPVGSGIPFENRPPFQAITFIIAVQGIFPSRN